MNLSNIIKNKTLVKYVRYNLFGLAVFGVSSFIYWIFGAGGWIAFVLAGFFGGLFEFTIQNKFVYGNEKLFSKISPRLQVIDDFLRLDEET